MSLDEVVEKVLTAVLTALFTKLLTWLSTQEDIVKWLQENGNGGCPQSK